MKDIVYVRNTNWFYHNNVGWRKWSIFWQSCGYYFPTMLLNFHNAGNSFLVPFLVNTIFKFSKLFQQQNFLWMRILKVTDSFSFSETNLELAPSSLKHYKEFFFRDFLCHFTRFFVLIFIQDIIKNAYYHICYDSFWYPGFWSWRAHLESENITEELNIMFWSNKKKFI